MGKAREFVSTNGGCRNLRTNLAVDIGGNIGVVLSPISELCKGETEVVGSYEVWELFDRVDILVVVIAQTVEVEAVGTTPVGKATNARGGVRFSIGPVDIEVGVGDASVDGYIVSIALTLVVEDIVEDMDIGRSLDAEA